MLTLRITTVIFFAFVCSISSFADEALHFFVEACRHSGFNPAEIATFQAELKIVTQTNYPDSYVEARIQQMIESARVTYKGNEAEKQQAEEKDREHLRQTSFTGEPRTELVKVSLRNSCAPLGLDDVLGQALVEDMVNKRSSLFQMGTQLLAVSTNSSALTPVGPAERVSMFQPDGGRRTTIDDGTRSGANGGNHYSAGRIRSVRTTLALRTLLSRGDDGSFAISDACVIALKKACENREQTFTLSKERVKYEGEHSAYILEIYEKGALQERFWIDPDRGYICPKEQVFHPVDGTTMMYECTSANFILDAHSQKWFPEKVTSTSWRGQNQDIYTSHSEIRTSPGTLILNKPIPDSVFALTVQKDTPVSDFRREDNSEITFFANQTGTLDLPTVEEKSLDDIEWLTPREVAQPHGPYVLKRAP